MNDSPSLSRFYLLERTSEPQDDVADPAAEVCAALDALRLDRKQLAGRRIAVAAGSRGIASLREIVRAACQWLISRGAIPFIFPAMGSHGGATDEGQRQVLAEYGVTAEFTGVEIRSSIEAVQIATTPQGFPVFMDRNAWQSDGVLVINRVKPHTRFSGKIESGLLKMMVIGMGKPEGARQCHLLASKHGYESMIRAVAGSVLATGKILAGLAVVENSRHQVASIRAAQPGNIIALDEEMQTLAKSLRPRLPFSQLHLLMVDEIGKDVSGAGMDTKVIGRDVEGGRGDAPEITLIYARDLTPETAGNALGVGLADLIHERLYRKIDFDKMYVNARTSLNADVARVPMWFRADRDAVDFALRLLGSPGGDEQRLVAIRNTLNLDRILVSEALAAEAAQLPSWRVGPESTQFQFDHNGNLPLPVAN
jgi:Lactate racemase N-terminal domain